MSQAHAGDGHGRLPRAAGEPIRVMLVISNLEYGGAQRQAVELANNMDRSGFDVHICSLSDYIPLATHLRDAATRLHVIRKRFKLDITVVPRLVGLLKALKIDIVQSYLFDADIASRLAGLLAGTPAIVGSERNTNYHLKWRQLAAYGLTRGCIDLIIANSNAGAAFNRRMLRHHVNQYRVVHNGVDVTQFTPQEGMAARRALGIEDDEHAVGIFASFKPQKNHALFFGAARRVLERMPRVRFLLVGDMLYGGIHGSAEYKHRMDRLVDELGIRSRCVFLGNREDVAVLYAACDVTVLTSLFEGTPNVLLESMACGVPVVATDVSDNARVVLDGRTGWLAPLDDEAALADRICMLLANEPKRRAMGEAGRVWVEEEFSTAALARKTESVYLNLLGVRRKGMPVRVAIATHFPEDPGAPQGGVEAVSVNLVSALTAFDDLELHVITTGPGQTGTRKSMWKNVTIHRLPRLGRRVLSGAIGSGRRQMSRYLRGLLPHIVHAHDIYGLMVEGLSIPRILTIHGFIYGDTLVSGEPFRWLRSRMWRWVETTGWAAYPHVISISPYVREHLTGLARGVIHDIENPVGEAFFHAARHESKGTIFSAAVISPRKNTLALIDALAHLTARGVDARLRLAGAVAEPRYGRLVKDRIRAHGLGGRVTLLGQISSDQVRAELASASVFALASLEENSPMGIAEALAVGVPVVTSNRCGMPYMVRHGETGFLVDPRDPEDIARRLETLLAKDALRTAMGERARHIAGDRFHPEAVARHTREVYLEAIGSHGFRR